MAVIGEDNLLADDGGYVRGDVRIVYLGLQIVERPLTIERISLMTGVGAGGGIAFG